MLCLSQNTQNALARLTSWRPELKDLGAALARTVSALEKVRLEALVPEDRDSLERALAQARAAPAEYRRAIRTGEPFPPED